MFNGFVKQAIKDVKSYGFKLIDNQHNGLLYGKIGSDDRLYRVLVEDSGLKRWYKPTNPKEIHRQTL